MHFHMLSRKLTTGLVCILCVMVSIPSAIMAQEEDPVYLKRKVVDADGDDIPDSRSIPDITFTAFLNNDLDSVLIENAPRWDGGDGNWEADFSRVGVELQNFYHFEAEDTAYIRVTDRVLGQQGIYSQPIDTVPWSDPKPFGQIQLQDIDVPAPPQNASIDLSADYERTLNWEAESGMEYRIYRKERDDVIFNGERRNLYTLQAEGVTGGEWTDPNTSSQRKFAYIIYAVNSNGTFSSHSKELSQEKPSSETSVYFKRFVQNVNGQRIDKREPEITFTAFLNNEEDSVLLENAPRLDQADFRNIDPTNGVVGVELQLFPQFEAMDTVHIRVTDTVLREHGTMTQVIDTIPWNDPKPFESLTLHQSNEIPTRPQNVELTISDVALTNSENIERRVTWDTEVGVTYRIYRRNRHDTLINGIQRNLYVLQEKGITSGSWIDPSNSADSAYGYVVYAENNNGVLSSHSREVVRTKPLTGLQDTSVTTKNVSLSWDAFTPLVGETAGYNIYRRTESGSYGSPENYTGPQTHYTDSRLEPGQTYYYKVVPRNMKREEVGEAQEVQVTTESSGNYTSYANLNTAVVIYKNTNHRSGGDYEMSDSEVEDIKEHLETAREFYWRNTEMQLNFEFDYIIVDEYKQMSDQSGQSTRQTGQHLAEDYGVVNTQYDFVFRLTATTGGFWSWGATNLLNLPGPDRRTGFSQLQWPLGSGGFNAYPGEYPDNNVDNGLIWLYIHEAQHAVDGIYRHNGFPEMGHGDFPELYGNPDLDIGSEPGYPMGDYPSGYPEGWGVRFGKRFDFQATMFREFYNYKNLLSNWGEIIQAEDQDGDGMPDHDARVPFDEQSFGSSPTEADTDGDGYTDKQEAIDGIYHYSFSNPNKKDTDGDGLEDGQDPNPRYPMRLSVKRKAENFSPRIDGTIDEWPGITKLNDTVSVTTNNTSFSPELYMAYDSDSLYFAISMPKDATPTVKWDFDADGRWYGSGNTNMIIDAEGGNFSRLRTWDADKKVQEWLENNRDRASGDGMWDNSGDYRSAFGSSIFSTGDINLSTSGNSEGGYDIEMAIPKNEQAGLTLEAGQDIGVIADYSGVGSSGSQATTFDQWSYEYVTLCDCPTTDVPEEGADPIAHEFELQQNYPNPFNPTTNIKYSLPASQNVTLKVYNMLGREVATLVNQKQSAGVHTVTFDAKDLSSGVYFYRIKTENKQKVRKMLLVK